MITAAGGARASSTAPSVAIVPSNQPLGPQKFRALHLSAPIVPSSVHERHSSELASPPCCTLKWRQRGLSAAHEQARGAAADRAQMGGARRRTRALAPCHIRETEQPVGAQAGVMRPATRDWVGDRGVLVCHGFFDDTCARVLASRALGLRHMAR